MADETLVVLALPRRPLGCTDGIEEWVAGEVEPLRRLVQIPWNDRMVPGRVESVTVHPDTPHLWLVEATIFAEAAA